MLAPCCNQGDCGFGQCQLIKNWRQCGHSRKCKAQLPADRRLARPLWVWPGGSALSHFTWQSHCLQTVTVHKTQAPSLCDSFLITTIIKSIIEAGLLYLTAAAHSYAHSLQPRIAGTPVTHFPTLGTPQECPYPARG